MSAVDEYRVWCQKHFRESPGFDLADAAITALEAELANKTTSRDLCREKCVRLISALNRAKADRDRTLRQAWENDDKGAVWGQPTSYETWLDSLRARAEERSTT